ncbi:uncharacterized protein LOC129603513 [Betta splendens]|uniref:Uncharacterized protein LOC129603513 n=1 Tax=Betta splendens TaxID=158456 RepID=A0A9W2XHD4_BETSP|nr:uncharacterized protein LOC129603513 [Betta splendens]
MSDNSTPPLCVEPEDSSSPAGVNVSMAFNVSRVCLLLPLSSFVLLLGYRQWQQQRSFGSMSHADVLTCHNAALQLVCSLGTAAYVYGTYREILCLQVSGWWISWMVLCGEIAFHLLTCVERYLAVVHPVLYRALKSERGVRIRNVSIVCAWLLCVMYSTAASCFKADFHMQVLCVLGLSLLVVSFCSVSVLRALLGPGPGERERVDPVKRRAFVSVMAITAVLWLWFVGLVVGFTLSLSFQCSHLSLLLRASAYWFMMPGSLVLPVLYLHRTGQIRCSRNRGE